MHQRRTLRFVSVRADKLVVERGIVAGSVSATLVKNAFATLPITFTALAPVDQPTAWHLLGSNDAFAAGS